MPVRVAALAGDVFLDVDGSGAEYPCDDSRQRLIVELRDALGIEHLELPGDGIGELEVQRCQRCVRVLPQVALETRHNDTVEVRHGVAPTPGSP
jgi:hypothetical protein